MGEHIHTITVMDKTTGDSLEVQREYVPGSEPALPMACDSGTCVPVKEVSHAEFVKLQGGKKETSNVLIFLVFLGVLVTAIMLYALWKKSCSRKKLTARSTPRKSVRRKSRQ